MSDRPSETDREYYETLVEAKAEEVSRAGKPENVEKIIAEVLKRDDLHAHLLHRFRRDVERRVGELKQGSHDAREHEILEKFNGFVQVVDGKYLPSAIDRKFKVRVKAGGIPYKFWRTGEVYNRVIGTSVDADAFHKIVEETQRTEDEIEQLQIDLELLRAAQKSNKELLKLSGAGFFAKLGASGIGEFRAAAADAAKEYQQGLAQKKADKKEMNVKSKLLKEKKKRLAIETERREKTIGKVTELREKSRNLFDRTFKAELQKLVELKPKMKGNEYELRIQALKRKVRDYGQRHGMAHMEIFLEEALGEKIPETELERKRKLSISAKWWNEITGITIGKADTEQLVSILGSPANKDLLSKILEGKAEDITKLLKFFYKGEYGNILLPEDRRAKPTLENLEYYLKFAPDYLQTKGELERVLRTFVDHFDASAENFDYYYSYILQHATISKSEEQIRNEKEKSERTEKEEVQKFAVPFWRSACGEQPTDHNALALLKLVKGKFPVKYQKVLAHEPFRAIASYFFTGKYGKQVLVQSMSRQMDPDPKNMFTALVSADEFINRATSDDDMEFAMRAFGSHADYRNRPLSDFTPETFSEILDRKETLIRTGVPYGKPKKTDQRAA